MLKFPVGDSHVHPDCSVDAVGSLDDYCRRALELGLQEITFTTHYEITPAGRDKYGYFIFNGNRQVADSDAVKRYIEMVHKASEEFYPLGLKVLCGLEIGWHRDIYDRLVRELPEFDLDLIIGSIHEVNHVHIVSSSEGPDYFSRHEIQEWISHYFTAAEELAQADLVDVLGHLDMYKRYALPVYGEVIKKAHRPYLDSLFSVMREHELALEVNTSGIRHGVEEYYPSFEIINEARRAGVKITMLSSDAHHPDDLALDFETASQVVHELLPFSLERNNEY